MERERSGQFGWAAIGAFVLAYDLCAPETLSSAFKRAQPASTLLLGYTAAHLMGWLPDELDGFKALLNLRNQNKLVEE